MKPLRCVTWRAAFEGPGTWLGEGTDALVGSLDWGCTPNPAHFTEETR